MIENVELLFSIFGVLTVLFIFAELVLDIDTFAGKFISKVKSSKSSKIDNIDEELDGLEKI